MEEHGGVGKRAWSDGGGTQGAESHSSYSWQHSARSLATLYSEATHSVKDCARDNPVAPPAGVLPHAFPILKYRGHKRTANQSGRHGWLPAMQASRCATQLGAPHDCMLVGILARLRTESWGARYM